MSRVNIGHKFVPDSGLRTHEGGNAVVIGYKDQLLRSVMSCLLWEKEFYEDGEAIATRIQRLAEKVDPRDLAAMALRARVQFKLRHVPLHLLVTLIKRGRGQGFGNLTSNTIAQVVRRADEVGELVSMFWKANPKQNGRLMLSKQMRLGLNAAIKRFDDYQLAKYDRDAPVKLRDAIFLGHTKPEDREQAIRFAKLVNKSFFPKKLKSGFSMRPLKLKGEPGLESPDTWEVSLSAGKDKKATFTRLLVEKKLGYLALLRNLRNMNEAGVDRDLIIEAIKARKGAQWVLPFRFIAAARAAPTFERALDEALIASIKDLPELRGHTLVLVDVSGSMDEKLSAKSDLKRIDAAAALAALFPGDVTMCTFSQNLVEVPPRRGMAGVDAIIKSQSHQGTLLPQALREIHRRYKYDRLVVITDEQAHPGEMPARFKGRAYMINVASAKNGVGYGPQWIHIDGFSEAIFTYLAEYESH